MYGVERSVVTLAREVGIVEGKTMLEVKGNVGVKGVVAVVLVIGAATLSGSSQAVYCLISHLASTTTQDEGHEHTLLVLIWNFILNTVFVMLLTKSAVPMPLPLPILKPQPRLGLFGSPIVLAAVFTTILRSARSRTAGVAIAEGTRIMPVKSMVVSRECSLVRTENMLSPQHG
jgi:hypothetical protein